MTLVYASCDLLTKTALVVTLRYDAEVQMRFDYRSVEYTSALEALEQDALTAEDLDIECSPWQPIASEMALSPWQDLLFIDGRRRAEARVFLEDDDRQVAFGLLGTLAVGAVHCRADRSAAARFYEPESCWRNERVCIISSGQSHKVSDVQVQVQGSALGALEYKIASSSRSEPEAGLMKLQELMLASESDVAADLSQLMPEALVISDGPRPLDSHNPNALGYVKTIQKLRIGEDQLAVVRALKEGERSPLYVVRHSKQHLPYFEWFLRLRDPRPWYYTLAGMVRLQAYAGPDPAARLAEAQQLANWSCAFLPRFASRQYQDPRAPQQLLPIRALEAELGRRMGSMDLIRRRIMRHLAAQEA